MASNPTIELSRLKLYTFLVKNETNTTTISCIARSLEDASLDVNSHNVGAFVQPCGALDWLQLVDRVNKKFNLVESPVESSKDLPKDFPMDLPKDLPKEPIKEVKKLNKQRTKYLLQYVQEKYGNKKISTIINKLINN